MSNRETWRKYRKILCGIILLVVGACGPPLPPPENISPINEQGLFKSMPSDAELFQGGISHLGSTENPPDYDKARSNFDALVNRYPLSRWKGLSERIIHLLDAIQSCQAKNISADKALEDQQRLLLENEKLKKDVRHLNDKLKTETARLVEENEQMKKDIQLLKNLEIQLEKRDKMYR